MHQNVVCRNSLVLLEGILYLTTKRLLFYVGENEEESQDADLPLISEDILQTMASSPNSLSIPLESIDSASGKRGIWRPSLVIVWHNPPDRPETTKTEFIQKVRSEKDETFGQSGDINDWAIDIQEKAAEQTIGIQSSFSPQISLEPDSLESQILKILGDESSWTGFFKIEQDLEQSQRKSLDPDEIDSALKKLVFEKLIEQDKHGMSFRKMKGLDGRSKLD